MDHSKAPNPLAVNPKPEIDNISAKRRKFVNVVDPHIKKESVASGFV